MLKSHWIEISWGRRRELTNAGSPLLLSFNILSNFCSSKQGNYTNCWQNNGVIKWTSFSDCSLIIIEGAGTGLFFFFGLFNALLLSPLRVLWWVFKGLYAFKPIIWVVFLVTWLSCQISQIQIQTQKGDLAGDLGDGDLPGGHLHQLNPSRCPQVSCFCWELITADKKFSVGAPPSFAQNHEFGFQSNVN